MNIRQNAKNIECFLEFYKVDLNLPETKWKEIIGLAKSRWVERYKAYDTCHLLYRALVFTLELIEKRSLHGGFYRHPEEKYNGN